MTETVSKTLEERLAAIELEVEVQNRIEGLVEMVHQIDNDYAALWKNVNEIATFKEDFNRRLNEAEALRWEVSQYVKEIKVLSATLEKQTRVAKELFSGLKAIVEIAFAGKVLVTRPATREELKTGVAIPIRQATTAEIREQ